MSAYTLFNKALLLLDRGKAAEGEATLRDALKLAKAESNQYDEVQISCCLGEVLRDQEKNVEALDLLQPLLSTEYIRTLPKEAARAQKTVDEILK